MGNIGDPITPSIPLVGATGPQYATDIDSILTEVVARLSAKVPMSSLLVGSNLDMGGQALLNAAYLTLVNVSSTPGASPVNRFTSYLGNAWWVGPSGAVQLTNGAALNSAAVGGITGDYGGVSPAQFYYDAATTRYNAYSNFSTNSLGYVRALGFDIATNATAATYARLAFTGGTNYTLTLPSAVPGATSVVQMGTSGQLTASNTVTISPTFQAEPLMTYNKYAQVPTNPSASANITTDAVLILPTSTNWSWTSQNHGAFGLRPGDRITTVSVRWASKTAGTTTIKLRQYVLATGVTNDYQVWTDTATGAHLNSNTVSSPVAISGDIWYIQLSDPVGTSYSIIDVHVFYDHP